MTTTVEDVSVKVSELDLSKAIYSSDKNGSDEKGDGSRENPFKTAIQALKSSGDISKFSTIFVDAKDAKEGNNNVNLNQFLNYF
jgi:hypothetical protein